MRAPNALLPVRLLSTGKALPQQRVSSEELDVRLGHSRGYVRRKSGIEYRHHATLLDSQSGLAGLAVRDALKRANIQPSSIDLLISASGVQEQALPNTASHILEPAGLPEGTPGFDINASCFSFVTALHVAASLLTTQAYRRIVVVASDLASRGIDWNDAETSLIFGDGAAAVIVEAAPSESGAGVHAYRMETYPVGKDFCEIPAGGTRRNPRTGAQPSDYLFHMDGKRVFKLASQLMDGFLHRLLADSPYTLSDVDVVVPHQASHLGMQHLRKRVGVSEERIIDIYAQHGNQVSASIPTALHEALIQQRITPGRPVLLVGTAAGLTLGGMVLTV